MERFSTRSGGYLIMTAEQIEQALGLTPFSLTLNGDGPQFAVPELTPEQIAQARVKLTPELFIVPAWRIRTILRQRGILTQVEALIADLPEQPRIVVEEQMKSSNFERDHPLIAQIGSALGLSASDLDQIFVDAELLT